MKLTVLLTEPLWRRVGSKRVVVELDDNERPTLQALFGELVRQYPALGPDLERPVDELDSNYSLFVNDKLVNFSQRQQVELKDGDEVAILLPLAGG